MDETLSYIRFAGPPMSQTAMSGHDFSQLIGPTT